MLCLKYCGGEKRTGLWRLRVGAVSLLFSEYIKSSRNFACAVSALSAERLLHLWRAYVVLL